MVHTEALHVHPANLDQLAAWDGPEGDYWATHADAFERTMEGYDKALFDAAAIGSGDRVLDVGCGCGGTAMAAARRASSGSVVGVDLSAAMLASARRSAEEADLRNVEFVQADAQVHAWGEPGFDVVISRTAAMFFADRQAALANLRTALRPGGRIVLLVWQAPERNEWFLELTRAMAAGRQLPAPPPDAPHPFTMADPARTCEVLEAAGYADVTVRPVEESMVFGTNPDEAYDFTLGLLGWMLDGLDAESSRRARRDLRATIESHTGPHGVAFDSAAWLVTAENPE